MDAQQQLFGLMAVAEEHQKAVQAAIEGLAVERAALARERAALTKAAVSVAAVAGDVRKAAGEAVEASMAQTLGRASDAAEKALGEAVRPVMARLSGVVQAASEAEGTLKRAGQWFAWKWVGVAGGGLVGVCLLAYASLAWQLHQVRSLSEEKAELAAEVAQLEASVAVLEKKGGRIVMNTCGGRLCIEASNNQGAAAPKWGAGYWHNKEKGITLVIPNGY